MWFCLRRLKEEGKEGVELGQYLYEIYNHDVELRVSNAGVCDRYLWPLYISYLEFALDLSILCNLVKEYWKKALLSFPLA